MHADTTHSHLSRRSLTWVGAIALLLLCSAASAQRYYPDREIVAAARTTLSGDYVDVSIIDRTYGRELQVYPWHNRHYIAGNPGSVYQIVLTNRSGARVMAVVAVDGINVITGRNAAPDQGGYVLAPHQTITIDGWRKSNNRVAQFNFTTVPDSYAGRTGRWNQVGVIGVAVFAERMMRHYPQPYEEGRANDASRSGMPSPSAAPPTANQKATSAERSIGTGHGGDQWSPVSATTFERASSTPNEILRLDYDRREALVRRGILPRWRGVIEEPDAFPGGYVPDPPGR